MKNGLNISLRKSFGVFCLDLELTLPTGISVIFGASGSGKSTLLNLLAGMVQPDSGKIQNNGLCLFDSDQGINLRPETRGVGYVFQDDLLFPHMRVEGNLRYGMRDRNDRHYDELLALLGLEKLTGRKPRSLSGGERQRVQIARALLSKPRLLLMDEPLSNLDPKRRESFFPHLEAIRNRYQIPILYVSHQLDEGIRLADHGLLLDGGKVTASGPIHELFLSDALREFAGDADAGAVLEGIVERVENGLANINAGDATLISHDPRLKAGDRVRLRIKGRDVALAITRPEATSIMNILPATLLRLEDVDKTEVDAMLRLAGGDHIFARITRESARRLELEPGQKLFAMIKAVAVARS